MALLEAQAAGLPVVAGKAAASPASSRTARRGCSTPEGDAAAFAEAVGALLADPERRSAWAAAMRRAARRHDIAVAAELLDAAPATVDGARDDDEFSSSATDRPIGMRPA